MLRHAFGLTLAVASCLACAPSFNTGADSVSADSASHDEHDPTLHAEHMGGGVSTPAHDSSFAALQARGAIGMGVDQYTSTHTFEPKPDGGRITLRRNADDSAGVAQIRTHLEQIATAFASGDFTTPGFVHADNSVPGTDVMATKRNAIRYSVAPVARGGELIIQTTDSAALDAIHRFLAYQRREHRAGDGRSGPTPPPSR
jgi:hypothetical protein